MAIELLLNLFFQGRGIQSNIPVQRLVQSVKQTKRIGSKILKVSIASTNHRVLKSYTVFLIEFFYIIKTLHLFGTVAIIFC